MSNPAGNGSTRRPGLIDCDVHNVVPSQAALHPYLSPKWRSYSEKVGTRTYLPYLSGYHYPKVSRGAARADAWSPDGHAPGTDLDFLRKQLLDEYDIDYAVLNCLYRAPEERNEAYGAALASAVNDWQIDHWLEPEKRLRASALVPFENPAAAAAEVRRCAQHPGFVQVLLFPRTKEPLGRRKYWPIYEAAAERGLPVGIHFSSTTANPITAGGWPSFYIEDHTMMAVAFQAQLTSLIVEGVFDSFPELKLVLIEGGFAWIPSLLRRLDDVYERVRDEVPHLRRRPSEYLRDRVRVTTQPMEEPERPRDLVDLITEIGPETLMFSTDYPHWDFDNPHRAFQVRLPADLDQRIMYENARDCYAF
ncbi:MAG: amidohydrolase [Pseudonocardia sp.]|nr:amidohydrolase [Pseudonocardia sp.]MBO0876434.1 amidohydrolase [Pseudonocardia sp.]